MFQIQRCLLIVFISARKPKKDNSKSNQKVKWKLETKIMVSLNELDFSLFSFQDLYGKFTFKSVKDFEKKATFAN